MSKIIATPDAINAAIESLLVEGVEPSTKAVQQRVGGGSFSTIARGIERWRAEREASAAVPAQVLERGSGFIGAIWAIANEVAQRDVAAIRAQAQEQIAQAQRDLQEAQTEITRLEAVNADQESRLEANDAELQASRETLTQARIQAARAAGLDQDLAQVRSELSQLRRTAEDRGAIVARLTAERDAARSQAKDLMALVRPAETVVASPPLATPASDAAADDSGELVAYSYRCGKCSKRGQLKLAGDGHDGEMAQCEQCSQPVQIEWDGGVSLYPDLKNPGSGPESEPQMPNTPKNPE